MTATLKMKLPPHVTTRAAKDGGCRYYFRRRGFPLTRLPSFPGHAAFEKAYATALQESDGQIPVAVDRAIHGYRREYAALSLKRILSRVANQYKNTDCNLTVADIEKMLIDQDDRCAVSGIRFRYQRPEDLSGTDPYSPSVDRIDSSGHYTAGNCRVVLLAVNIALNEWGDDVFLRICKAVVSNRKRQATV